MMLVKNFFIVAGLLSIAPNVFADVDSEYDDDELEMQNGRDLATYIEPLWFERIAEEDTSGLLKRCFKKSVPPMNGSRCSRKAKVCYFDTQDCDGVGAHPVTKCSCDGKAGTQKWDCEPEVCPIYPDPAKTNCGPIVNDPTCPDIPPSGTCAVTDNPEQCRYGQDSCCGNCSTRSGCSCGGNFWSCFTSDECIPPCQSETWPALVGKTCLEARTEIFAKYPGMTVVCATTSDAPTNFDSNRFIVIVDAPNGVVLDVVFSRYTPPAPVTECPSSEGDVSAITTCDLADGEICSYKRDYNDPVSGANCEETTTYACQEDGTFQATGISQECVL